MNRIILTCLLLPFLWLPLHGQFGFLDGDFDGDGISIVTSASPITFNAVGVQPDGMIVAAGSIKSGAETQFLVMRFFPDGNLDMAFNGIGYQAIDFDPLNDNVSVANDLQIQADGKIVVAGTSFIASDDDMAITRLKANGTVDSTFALFGKKTIHLGIGTLQEGCNALAMDADGNFYLGGTHSNYTNTFSFIISKLDPSGFFDGTFGAGGTDTFPMPGHGILNDLILLQDGRILCGGAAGVMTSDIDFGLLLLKTNGRADSSFSTDGKLATHILGSSDRGWCLAQQSDGKILAAGRAGGAFTSDLGIARYSLTGSLDLSFDGDGKTTYDLDMEGDEEQINGIALQPDGKLLLAGYSVDAGTVISMVGRYNTDGSPDATFGTGGFTMTDVALSHDSYSAMALQPDLRLVTVGTAGFNAHVARYITGLVVSAPDAAGQAPLNLYPNPVQDQATLEFHLPHSGNVELLLTDLQGRVLHTFGDGIALNAGAQSPKLNLPTGLASGEYLVVLVTPQGNLATRLLKQ
jgi:uncharacterized delta-60 repeat protein